MKHGIKILYGILGIGILVSIFHIINDQGGSALGNIIDTFTITSIILFISTIIFIGFSFKINIKKISVWLLLILSFPLTVTAVTDITRESSLNLKETTTPREYIYNVKVNQAKYERDKVKIQNLVNSLIEVKIIERKSELASRYFNGKTYNDSIERAWAIDLPTKIHYKQTIVDTLFYSENGNEIIAGLLINKVLSDYQSGGIEYFGNGFLVNENEWKPIEILTYSVTGYDNYKSCSDRLRYYYFKKIGTYENELNMNDVRFLNRN